jgi:hypothetical protein
MWLHQPKKISLVLIVMLILKLMNKTRMSMRMKMSRIYLCRNFATASVRVRT